MTIRVDLGGSRAADAAMPSRDDAPERLPALIGADHGRRRQRYPSPGDVLVVSRMLPWAEHWPLIGRWVARLPSHRS
nr:hypothetical protein [Kibdelosporangium sp. MJ126-NF4]